MLLVIILLIALPAGIYLTDKTQIFNPKATETKPTQVIEKLTSDLINANKDYGRPGVASVDKEKQLVEMTSIASQRKEKLLQEIESDPASFLRHAVLTETKSQFPAQIQSLIENKLETQGKLLVLHFDDFNKKESKTAYKLERSESRARIHSVDSISQNIYNLHFAQVPPDFLPNSIVRIKGITLGNDVVLPGSQAPFVSIVSEPVVQRTGDVTLAVILFKFANTTTEPFSMDAVRSTMFTSNNSVENFYNENSFGQLRVDGTNSGVFGWYTIPYTDTSSCNYESWSSAASQQAQNAGVDLTNYTYKVYVFPNVPSCNYAGFAFIAGNRSWINGYNDTRIFAHELGHNFGEEHANALSCGSSAIGSGCFEIEYGDPYDVMGSAATTYHFNAPHKIREGWISGTGVSDVTQAGVYTLVPLETSSSGTKVLRIAKPDSIYTSEAYYVSYRRPIGFDSSIQEEGTRGVSIHVGSYNPTKTKLVDVTPGSLNGFLDATLSDNSYFYDSNNNISVLQTSHSDSSATVRVTFSPPPTPTTPTPSPTPVPQQIIELNAGWNLVGLTVEKGISYKASDFARELNVSLGNGSVVNVIAWDNGRYIVHTVGQSANDFYIIPDQAYFVRATTSGRAAITGSRLPLSSMSIPNGWSLIAFPQSMSFFNITNAESLLLAMRWKRVDAEYIIRWFAGRYIVHRYQNSSNNFPIVPGEGYFIYNPGSAGTFYLP